MAQKYLCLLTLLQVTCCNQLYNHITHTQHELAFVCIHTMGLEEKSSNVIRLNAQFCTHSEYLNAISNT